MKANFLKSLFAVLFIITLCISSGVTYAGNQPNSNSHPGNGSIYSPDPRSLTYWAQRLAIQYAKQAGYVISKVSTASPTSSNLLMVASSGTRFLVHIGADNSFLGLEILPN
jgi:uncharacterized membrane protein